MTQENNNEVMIQLPWAVPQQPLVQTTSILENLNKKMELNLTHSTDTTAIWSFIIAMIVAIILGISATFIAIWYGRKSFDLTKQSFDALVKQIESSEKIIQDSNQSLIASQAELKKYELEYLHRVEETNKLRNIVAVYLSHLVQFNIDITMNFKTYSTVDLIQEIIKFNTQIIKFHYQIELFLDSPSTDSHSKIENALKRVLNSVWEIRDSVENKEKFNMSLAIYSLSLQAVREELSNLIIQEIKKQKGE